MCSITPTLVKIVCFGLLVSSFGAHPAFAADDAAPLATPSRSLPADQSAGPGVCIPCRWSAALNRNLSGAEILWVDYDGAVSLHPVITSKLEERRAQRLATPSPLDNRISYGCINVPVEFFKRVVSPAFTGTNGIVYVLPETRPAQKVFASYDVEAREPSASQRAPAPGAAPIDAHWAGL